MTQQNNYLASRQRRGIPVKGRPLKQVQAAARTRYQHPRICRKECAAEYWRSIADLAMIPHNDPERAAIEREAQTWYRFATTDHAFERGEPTSATTDSTSARTSL